MGSAYQNDWDEVLSEIGDKPEVGFLDFEDDKSLHNFDPYDEIRPVTISLPFPFINGKPQSALVGETASDSITLTNTTSDPIDLWSIRIFSSNPEESYVLSVMKPPPDSADVAERQLFVGTTCLDDRTLQPGQTLTVWLSCKPRDIGLHTSIVHFNVGDEQIERVAFLLAEDKVSRSLFSNKPYSRSRNKNIKRFEHGGFVPGSRPTRQHLMGFKYKLPQYPIPPNLREIIGSKQIPEVLLQQLSIENYAEFFSTLIMMEEIHLEEEMRAYDMEGVGMKRRGSNYLSMEVPGLAERRPSLVYGDYILASLSNADPSNPNLSYQGFIHRVEADEIFLKFDKSFHAQHRLGDLYNVSFTYNRVNMRRLYKAVNSVYTLGGDLGLRLLFPSESTTKRVIERAYFTPINAKLNIEQLRSVSMILGCKGSPPYVIYGPPGTGKTVTLVESILQLYRMDINTRILVCSSSNSASDHVLAKILTYENIIRENEIFRLNAPSRPYDDISADFIRFCFFDERVFKCPPLNALMQYRIIICTYMSASMLQAEGVPKGHFSHIFLDEAGQASEPETLVPITNLSVRQTVVVLAGDPMQLGPVIYSKDADKYGLGQSYLERLFDCPYYQEGDENYVTKLVRNYRCHPAILDLPSRLFYKGELIPCRENYSGNMSCVYDCLELPNKEFPVLFIGIQGCDEREGNNPSWFNRIEASKVVDIIRKIVTNADVAELDIGVITPYRQQVLKLKKALELMELPDLKVGSVEQFQGQEREIIIISTVRSTVKHNEFDRVHNLGFLSNFRRFNVAITRARSLLVIVGNPHVISKDRNWDRLLRYCADNGSYQGCTPPPPETHFYDDDAETESEALENSPYNETQVNPQPEWDNNSDHQAQWNSTGPEQWSDQARSDHQVQGSTDEPKSSRWADQVDSVDTSTTAEHNSVYGWSDLSQIEPTGWD